MFEKYGCLPDNNDSCGFSAAARKTSIWRAISFCIAVTDKSLGMVDDTFEDAYLHD